MNLSIVSVLIPLLRLVQTDKYGQRTDSAVVQSVYCAVSSGEFALRSLHGSGREALTVGVTRLHVYACIPSALGTLSV